MKTYSTTARAPAWGSERPTKSSTPNTAEKIAFEILDRHLSSGEKVLMSIAFWLFHSGRSRAFPKLLLLDEPDAHLHPAMCKQLLHVLKDVLIKDLGVNVLMTTHNPTTVSLAPDDAIFEMAGTPRKIQKSESKRRVIASLTGGLVTVTDSKVVVVVEDEFDEQVYQSVFHEARQSLLAEGSELVFLQASRPRNHGRDATSTTGGRSEVEKWVPRLANVGVPNIAGLVDKDFESHVGKNIFLLPRHSIENFITDPIVVFAQLVAEGEPPTVPGVEIRQCRESTIPMLSETQLQSIADTITNTVANHESLNVVSMRPRPCVFSCSRSVMYPEWVFDSRGKDILRAYIDIFGGQRINRNKLASMFRRLMMLPADLIDLLKSIQSFGASC